MNFKPRLISVFLSVLLLLSLSACGGKEGLGSSASDGGNTSAPSQVIDESMFDDSDKKTEPVSPVSVALDGKTLNIGKAGEYVITNSITNGQLIVDTDKNSEVHLILSGVTITADSCPAIQVKKAKKVIITLAEGTENCLEVKGAFDLNAEDGAIYAKCDLTINGKGSLKISTESGKGITSKDNLVLVGGNFDIKSQDHAVDGNDSIRVLDGSFKINTEGDGFHVENLENTTLGFFYSAGGSFDISSIHDGIAASGYLKLDGGNYKIVSGDGSATVDLSSNHDDFGFGRWDTDTSDDTITLLSQKGIKSGGDLQIAAGSFSVDSADDCIHSNGNVTISGGSGTVCSGDDGIHADMALTLSGGSFNITKSYEGLEGRSITISGGSYSVVSSDDGLNAAGGNDQSGFGGAMRPDSFEASSDSFVKISGGKLNVNASGDGIDSNGDLTVSGGETYVSGSTNGGNGAMDFGGSGTITGGIFAVAGASGMAQNFSDSSTQGAMMVNTDTCPAGTAVKLTDSSGKEVFSHTFEKAFNSVVISVPEIKKGSTYTLTAGDFSQTVEMTSIIYGESNGMGGPGGGFGGGPGGHKQDKKPRGHM